MSINVDDYNILQSAYNNHGGETWRHNLFCAPGAADYLQRLEGFEKIGLCLGIEEVDENGRIASLNLDFHEIGGEYLESISKLSQLKSLCLKSNENSENKIFVIPE